MPIQEKRSKKEEKPIIFREDSLYHLNCQQQAALAFAFCSAQSRIARQADDRDTHREDVTQKELFGERYDDIFKHSIDKDTLVKIVDTLRNYFAHYLHKPDDIRNLKGDIKLQRLLPLLRHKAINVWKDHHAAWLHRYTLPEEKKNSAEELYNLIGSFKWEEFQQRIKDGGLQELEGPGCPVPFCDILLLLSIFISKGDMVRLLDKMPNLKQNSDNSGSDLHIRAKREVLSALCLDESHDLRSGEADIITALTILDHFAKRMGVRKDRNGDLIHNPPRLLEDIPGDKKLPDICRSHSTGFFIKMLVAAIEACDFLPGVCIARARDGVPVFVHKGEQPRRPRQLRNWIKYAEPYIKGSNVAIAITRDFGDPLTGSLSINALKLIALKGMEIRKNYTEKADRKKQYKKDIVQPILDCLERFHCVLPQPLYSMQKDWLPFMRPKTFREGSLSAATDETQDVVNKRIKYLKQREKNIRTDHQKALYILWWINRRLLGQHGHCLTKDRHQEALWALTGTYDSDAFRALLDTVTGGVSGKALQWNGGHQTMGAALKAPNLEGVFQRIRKDFSWYTSESGPAQSNDEGKLHVAAKVLGVRHKKSYSQGNIAKAREAFCKRFGRQLGPLPCYLWSHYFPKNYKDYYKKHVDRNGNIPNTRLPIFKIIDNLIEKDAKSGDALSKEDMEFRPDKDLYYYHCKENGKKRLLEKARICLEHDSLLLFLAEKLITERPEYKVIYKNNFSYEAWIPVTLPQGGEFTLTIDSSQARRSYVSQHPMRIKNVLTSYWLPDNENTKKIPFYRERTEESPEAPQSWLEAEYMMERERQILIQAVLRLEKETAEKYAKNKGIDPKRIDAVIQSLKLGASHIKTDVLFATCGVGSDGTERKEMKEFRDWALHQSPEKAFSKAPSELGKLFWKIKNELEEKRKNAKREGNKNAQKQHKKNRP